MRKAALGALVVVLLSGCGGGGKKGPELTRAQYVADLNKLCTSANRQVAALRLTTDIATWKQNGPRAYKIAKQTVDGFKALTPPDALRDAADAHNRASSQVVEAVKDASDAARTGDRKKFDDAISRQQNFGLRSNAAASKIGAAACA